MTATKQTHHVREMQHITKYTQHVKLIFFVFDKVTAREVIKVFTSLEAGKSREDSGV